MTVEISEFRQALMSELVKRGIPADTASYGITGITKNITDEKRVMIDRIKTADDLGRFADALALRIKNDAAKAKATDSAQPQPKPQTQPQQKPQAQSQSKPQTQPQPKPQAQPQPKPQTQPQPKPQTQPQPKPQTQPQPKPQTQPKTERRTYTDAQPTATFGKTDVKNATAKFVSVKKAEPTTAKPKPQQIRKESAFSDNMNKGDRIFLAVLIAGSPIWVIALGLFLLPSLISYFGICVLIAVCVAALLAVTVFGTSVSLCGIIYGIIKLFSVRQEGMYEIGLAAIILGATLIVVILLYNLAVRYIPKLFVYAKQLLNFQTAKASDFYYYIRKECHRR